MPYTTPSTVTSSDVLTAALWNTQVRSNFQYVVSPPMCVLEAAPSVGSGSTLIVPFSTENIDTDNMHNNATNNTRITINTAGIYLFTIGVEGTSNAAAAWIRSSFLLNGLYLSPSGLFVPVNNTHVGGGVTTLVREFNAGDYMEARVSTASTQTITTRFSAVWQGFAPGYGI